MSLTAVITVIAAAFIQGFSLFAGYFTNGAFLTPLSETEEKGYLERLKKGDEAARNILIERNLRLVAHIVKKFDNMNEDADDLISIGTIGLIKAINSFDLDKKARLATYAARCIENEILMHFRAAKKARSEISMYEPIAKDKEGNDLSLSDILGTEPDVTARAVENKLEEERLLKEVNKLHSRERQVLEMRFGILGGLKRTQRDIAKIMGISRSYVSRIEKKAILKIAKHLTGEDLL